MRYLKTKHFARWAEKANVLDSLLRKAIREFEQGLYEADLGHHLFKKRIALHGRGKSSGARTILFYQQEEKIVFCFGFAKNVKENLDETEKKIFYRLSKDLLEFKSTDLDKLVQSGVFIEIAKKEEEK